MGGFVGGGGGGAVQAHVAFSYSAMLIQEFLKLTPRHAARQYTDSQILTVYSSSSSSAML